MEVLVKRKYFNDAYTIGNLLIDGAYFCDTLEDKDRGLKQNMNTEDIKKIKVYGETAVPKGRYIVRMDIISNKYANIDWYKKNFRGRMPRLDSVKGFEGILIHPGNTALDCLGCILVGRNKQKGKVLESRDTFLKLWRIFEDAYQRKETIYLTIE